MNDDLSGRYFDAAMALLARIKDEEAANISAAGALIADTVTAGGRLFAFGAGHSALAAQDVVYRAGGLALMNLLSVPGVVGIDIVPATLSSALERVNGLASAALRTSPAREGDALFVISLSGRNVLPVEMAMTARTLGMKVIGVTSVTYARETESKHESGTFLLDHCDVVLDSKIAMGDAELDAPGVPTRFASVSTIATSAIMQSVMATAVATLAERGTTPPLLRSGNVGDGLEWNERIMTEYGDRIFYTN